MDDCHRDKPEEYRERGREREKHKERERDWQPFYIQANRYIER